MQIDLSQQMSATHARNNFKEMINKTLKEGICTVMRKSKPVVVVLSVVEFEKLKNPQPKKKKAKKFDLDFLRKNSYFEKYVGCLDDKFDKNLSSVDISKQWTKYVD